MDYYKLKVLNNKKKILFIFLFLIIIGGILFYYFTYYKKEDSIIIDDNENENNVIIVDDNKEIIVDIKGYVNEPGVYSFKDSDNARVNDLILKAGGLKKGADTSLLNLSKKLEDEMTVIIYSKDEINNIITVEKELEKKLMICEEKLKNDACIGKSNSNNLVNINTASKEVLMTLPGIGEGKALAIIEYRKKSIFNTIDDIKNVEGIGENLFESIKESITV